MDILHRLNENGIFLSLIVKDEGEGRRKGEGKGNSTL